MSYVEHGLRIFLAGSPATGVPLVYGDDYVLPRKRSEGRLKLYDSCSDIRAWSPNALENSRYFRELTEHALPVGRAAPLDVPVDNNVIGVNSQAQEEHRKVKEELERYKRLKLTPEQERSLRSSNNRNPDSLGNVSESSVTRTMGLLPSNTFLNIGRSVPLMQSTSYLSIIRPHGSFRSNRQDSASNRRKESCSSDAIFQENPKDEPEVSSSSRSVQKLSIGDHEEKMISCIEYSDAALQVERETHEVGTQCEDLANECSSKRIASGISQTSLAYVSSNEESSDSQRDRKSLRSNNPVEKDEEYDSSCSQESQDAESLFDSEYGAKTDSELETRDNHKGIIIEKDSEIIVLKNELYVREAELEEFRELNKNLETLLKKKEEALNVLQDKFKVSYDELLRKNHQRNMEAEELKKKLTSYNNAIAELKEDSERQRKNCHVHCQEMENLRSYAKETATLRLENDCLSKKIREMEESSKEAELRASKELKELLRERDELKKRCQEQSCMLADQEDEINRLLVLINQMSVTYTQQAKTEELLNTLKAEVQKKNAKISQYERELVSTRRDFDNFFDNLRKCLNGLNDLNFSYEDVHKCAQCDSDIGEEAADVLRNLNVVLAQLRRYKMEREEHSREARSTKERVPREKQDFVGQNTDEETEQRTTGIGYVNTSGTEDENLSSCVNSDNSTSGETRFLNVRRNDEPRKRTVKLSMDCSVDEVENEILKQVSYSLFKMQSLMHKFQVYVDVERQAFVMEIHNFQDILKEAELAITCSGDSTAKKEKIMELYKECKAEYKKYNLHAKHILGHIYEIHIKANRSIEAILRHHLRQIICSEEREAQDRQIDEALRIRLESYIGRMNSALRGAGDQRAQITEEITKYREGMRKKDMEITRLKEEVAKEIARRMEEDSAKTEFLRKNDSMKEELLATTTALREKDTHISTLRDKLVEIEKKLSVSTEDRQSLKKEIKNLQNIRDTLLSEQNEYTERLKSKDKEISNMARKLHDLIRYKDIVSDMEKKLNEMEKTLRSLERDNDQLRKKVERANEAASRKEEIIVGLRNDVDKNYALLAHRSMEYNATLEKNRSTISELRSENRSLSQKLKETESRVTTLNATVLSLTEENDKIDVIYALQEDLGKLDKSERKLKAELTGLKTQLTSDRNANRNLESKVEAIQRENENLKKEIDYWKQENTQLSIVRQDQAEREKCREVLTDFSDKIRESISSLKQRLNVNEKNHAENETETSKSISVILDRFNASGDNLAQMKNKLKRLENENKQKQKEIAKLLHDVETRDAEIKSLKENVNSLTLEKSELRTALQAQVQEYQDKLTLMKKNYDGSLSALCERHRESVERLQMRFEDTMMGDGHPFDANNWLQSLSMKELIELHERICMYSSCLFASNELNVIPTKVEKDVPFSGTDEFQQKFPTVLSAGDKDKLSTDFDREQNLRLKNVDLCDRSEKQVHEDKKENNSKRFLETAKIELVDGVTANDVFVRQRWNFINQCSVHHKWNNAY